MRGNQPGRAWSSSWELSLGRPGSLAGGTAGYFWQWHVSSFMLVHCIRDSIIPPLPQIWAKRQDLSRLPRWRIAVGESGGMQIRLPQDLVLIIELRQIKVLPSFNRPSKMARKLQVTAKVDSLSLEKLGKILPMVEEHGGRNDYLKGTNLSSWNKRISASSNSSTLQSTTPQFNRLNSTQLLSKPNHK